MSQPKYSSKLECTMSAEDIQRNPEAAWDIIASYFDNDRLDHLQQLVRHQIESYNDFVQTQIRRTVEMFTPITVHSEQDFDKESGKYALTIYIRMVNLRIYLPQIFENNGAMKLMFPQEARLRNFTYMSNMAVDMDIKYEIRSGPNLDSVQVIHNKLSQIQIGKLPIMLGSCICVLTQYKHVDPTRKGECALDAGGYFIVHGTEKACLPQERAAENQVSVFDVSKGNTRWSWSAEIKSVPDWKCISPKQAVVTIASKNNGFGYGIYFQIPRIKQPIPLFILFRALGVESDQAICERIVLDLKNENNKEMLNFLEASVFDASDYPSTELCLEYITNYVMFTPLNMDKETGQIRKREFAKEVLDNDIFPHCRTKEQRLYFLGYMTAKLLRTALGKRPADDRDAYQNKRVDLVGVLLNNLFRNYFNKMVKEMQKQIVREINSGSWRSKEDYLSIINPTNIYKIVKSATVENGFKRALATGDFATKQGANTNKVGTAQVMNRHTYASGLSQLRRVNTPVDKSGKLVAPRKLHSSSWGFLCPSETPEGHSVGVVKNLSYMTHVTIPSSGTPTHDYVMPHITPIDECSLTELDKGVKVFVNGCWMGIAKDPIECYQQLKQMKFQGVLNVYTSIVFDYKYGEIRVCNDAGRLTRPVLRVQNNDLVLTSETLQRLKSKELAWTDLILESKIDKSVIEYIDPAEQASSMIAMRPNDLLASGRLKYRYTHCEIHPSTILGLLASCIPFPEHNQSPRITYQCAMGKQAMGVYVTNFDQRLDKTSYVLTTPMRPLVDTRLMGMLRLDRAPSGCMVIVAIMTHTGFNQEDSILVNQGSLNRGLFQATVYHTEKDEDKKIHGDEEIRCKPDPKKTKSMKFADYSKLTSQGVMPENSLVCNRDVIIGKVVPIKENRNDHTKTTKYVDHSRIYRTTEESYIDKNYIDRNGDGYNVCKVRVRVVRTPVIGDKFSSRHGQKGTIGNIIPEADMPVSANGLKPDIIINPHAIPSRMTIGQLKETLLGKVLVQLGLFGDGTAFGNHDIKDIRNQLLNLGYECHGEELLYNGMTGEQLETSVFMGPAFYQRLKHMVNDKQHSRSSGPMVNLTRQPAEGRARDGGLRFGEMERDCMVSHGASRFMKDRMYDCSDKYEVHVCKSCGLIAAYNDKQHIHWCRTCDNRSDFSRVQIPYATKLLMQELMTMNIAPRIVTDL